MRLIFLDVDGVLNSDIWYNSTKHKLLEYPYNQFNPNNVELINRLVKRSQAKVVLTSSWRKKYSITEINDIFINVGLKINLIDFTPILSNENNWTVRGNEILKWCIDNEAILGCNYKNYIDYAIIDDTEAILYWQRNNFHKTDRYCGITPSNVTSILKMFQRHSQNLADE